jgi:integrase
MIYKSPTSRYLMVRFMYRGKYIRKSSRTTNRKLALVVEAKIRSELARGDWGILERKPAPILRYFLKNDFLPFIQSTCKTRIKGYYEYGVQKLLRSDLCKLRMDQINDQRTAEFVARHANFSPSTINAVLRTLRRVLKLAEMWGKLERAPKITLLRNERVRERVLSDSEAANYLAAAPPLWRDVATVLLGTGARPGEIYALRWENVFLNGQKGVIQITSGKTASARRTLPMIAAVRQVFQSRFEEQNHPAEGWIFPAGTKSGHVDQGSFKKQHRRALKISEVTPFEPYCLRHTALTRLAESGCDVFTLARIAGHASISITQRYVHSQSDSVERAFTKRENSRALLSEAKPSQGLPVEVLPPENKNEDRSSVQ